MTSVTPTITVLLDDGTGTYPTDITSRVNLSQGVSVSGHGRTDEFSQATAATFTCTLNNNDGHLSNGTIALSVAQGIRYKQHFGSTTVNRFTGRISEAALGLSATGKASAVVLTAVDPLSSLARRPMRSMLEHAILALSPSAYYTLGEPEGSTSAGDTSGNAADPLTFAGTGAAVVFGSATGPADGMAAAQFGGGQYLQSTLTTPATYTLLCVISRNSIPGSGFEVVLDSPGGQSLLIRNGDGNATLWDPASVITPRVISAGTVCDGALHLVGISVTAGVGFTLFTDGGVATLADVSASGAASGSFIVGAPPFSGTSGLPGLSAGFNGAGSHVAYFPGVALTAPQVADFWAIISGTPETTAARFNRIAGYAGVSTSTPSNSGQLVGAQATSGSSFLDALQNATTSEGGVMFANGTGTLVMQGRNYRALNATADLTIPGKDIDVGTTVPLDDQQVVNQVTVTREGGSTQVYPSDLSLGTADRYPQSLDLIVTTDADALTAAQWLANKHSTAAPRVGTATVKLLTSSQAEQLIQAEIGDRWALSSMPTQLWSGAGDLSLEGWSETLTVGTTNEWSMTANLLPFAIFQAGLWSDTGSRWDSAVWGY